MRNPPVDSLALSARRWVPLGEDDEISRRRARSSTKRERACHGNRSLEMGRKSPAGLVRRRRDRVLRRPRVHAARDGAHRRRVRRHRLQLRAEHPAPRGDPDLGTPRGVPARRRVDAAGGRPLRRRRRHRAAQRRGERVSRATDVPGEKTFWRELNESILSFDGGIERAFARRDEGAGGAARATLDELERAADRVSSAAAAAIEFNARNGRDLALRIRTVRRNAEWVGYVLTTSLALLTLLAGSILRRQVRRQRALAEEHAAILERRATELETFAGRAAHDILNPVSATQLALALASKREISDDRVRELVDRGLRNLHRIRTVIDDLLQFARAGARPAPGASADVAAVLDDVADGIRPTAEAAGIEPVDPCRASCSVGVLTSVISNLAHNAMKYIGEATPRRVTLRVALEDGFVRLEVEDSGPGIPPALMGDIFRPYVRGPTQGKDGLGLGLATVKRLCESHGGRVGVRSAMGRGSVFWVELPQVRDDATARTREASPEPAVGHPSTGR